MLKIFLCFIENIKNMSHDILKCRIDNIRKEMKAQKLDGFLITHQKNQRYLTGFTGSTSWLIVTYENIYLFVDGRYTEQASKESPHVTLVDLASKKVVNKTTVSSNKVCPEEIISIIKKVLPQKGRSLPRLGFEPHVMVVQMHKELTGRLKKISFVPVARIVESQRAVKDETEVVLIVKALRMAEKGLSHVFKHITLGVKEQDLAAEFQYSIKKMGGEKEAFDTIVASGVRSALPHGRASGKAVSQGETILFDLGVLYEGYYSDLTRTVSLPPGSKKGAELHRILREAQNAAFLKIAPGVKCKDVDLAARGVIDTAGYGEYFTHGLGHGVGLEIHELPSLNKRNETVLKAGMVVTVEPGIYIPGVIGARLEDMVLVTPTGCEVLTKFRKSLSI